MRTSCTRLWQPGTGSAADLLTNIYVRSINLGTPPFNPAGTLVDRRLAR
ncbi:MAG: hypothetical protein ABI567_10900 [Gammaproteobacteria bacterium]